MPRDWIPRPYQPPIVQHILRHPRCNVFAGMGMGKTSALLTAFDVLQLSGQASRMLVVAPLRVARTTWPEEVARWTHTAHLKVVPIVGTQQERTAALLTDADIHTINYENVPWLVNQITCPWKWDMVVADEVTVLKSTRTVQGSARGKALMAVAFTEVKRWVGLTGTPAPNGLEDLYGQMLFIDRGARLGKSYSAFENRWFGFQRANDARTAHKTHVKRVAFPHAQAEIQGLIKDVCLSLDPKDWFPIDEPVVNNIYVDLPKAARLIYQNMERDLFAEIRGYDVEAFDAATKSIKLLGVANGSVYTGAETEVTEDLSHWVEIHTEKLDALESIITEACGAPILVAYHFKPDLARILHRFPQAVHIKSIDSEAAFKAGKIAVGVVHAQSVGHGVDGFQNVTSTLVFFAHWWAMENRAQLIERIGPVRQIQAGHLTIAGRNRPVFIHNIVARNTIDEVVLQRVASKRSVQDLLLEYMKRKENEQ